MKTILTPIDSSVASNAVVATASVLAKALPARVVLLTVVQPPVFTAEYTAVLENVAEIVAIGEKAAANHLARHQAKLEADGVSVESVQFTGAPVVHIIEQANKARADFIVMGSHGHTAVYDLLVGSTTHGVLKRAQCPVVIVPPGLTKKK
ncbi:MAG TPA: universal stress protein [Opitutus sp.]|nr:universal stress protein [Opitutus sp.]